MYTIFVNENVIYLTDSLVKKEDSTFFNYDEIDIGELVNKLENSTLQSVYLYHANLNYLWKNFQQQFKVIEAAGGIVFNEKEEILWIYRNDKWDLPKGKIEKDESREVAAVREVEEECGISDVILKKFVNTTYHIYEFKKKRVLKVTYWYTMFAEYQLLTPQTEEGITKVAWLNEKAMEKAIENTYSNIKLLFNNSSTVVN